MSITIQRGMTELASKLKGVLIGGVVAGGASTLGLDVVVLWVWNSLLHGLWSGLPVMPDNVAAVITTVLGVVIGGYVTPDKLPSGTSTVPVLEDGKLVIKTPAAQAADVP